MTQPVQLVDTLISMSNALKAGFSITQAFEQVVRDGQNPIAQEFDLLLPSLEPIPAAAFVNDANEHNDVFEPTRIRRGIGGGPDVRSPRLHTGVRRGKGRRDGEERRRRRGRSELTGAVCKRRFSHCRRRRK